jgi:hypothetical protein
MDIFSPIIGYNFGRLKDQLTLEKSKMANKLSANNELDRG